MEIENIILNNEQLVGQSIIKITDELGRTVYSKDIDVKMGINLYVVEKLEVYSGVYYISIINGEKKTQVLKQVIR